jgi:pimeloyl-ACP methyl ester carboxylesterase
MPAIVADDLEVEYFVDGSGTPTVLLHGSSMDAETNFGPILGLLGPGRTLIRPNFSGSGNTPLPPGELSLARLTEQAVAVIGRAAAGPVDLVGFSLGAVVAADVAARHPDLVDRLVLVAGWPDSAEPRLHLGFESWARAMEVDPDLASRQGPLMAFSPAFLSSIGAEGIALIRSGAPAPGTGAQVDLCRRVDIRDELRAVLAPTLVVGCALDYLVPVQNSRELHRAIAHSRYVELECGHVATAERPQELADALTRFLA